MEIKLTRWFVYEWGKSIRQKPHWMILRLPLLRIHYYHNKWLQVKKFQYLIPTYSWTLIPIPNWTCSIVKISSCNAWLPIHDYNCTDPSMRLQSPTKEGCWLQNSLVHHMMKIQKILGHKTLWCTNTATSSQER